MTYDPLRDPPDAVSLEVEAILAEGFAEAYGIDELDPDGVDDEKEDHVEPADS